MAGTKRTDIKTEDDVISKLSKSLGTGDTSEENVEAVAKWVLKHDKDLRFCKQAFPELDENTQVGVIFIAFQLWQHSKRDKKSGPDGKAFREQIQKWIGELADSGQRPTRLPGSGQPGTQPMSGQTPMTSGREDDDPDSDTENDMGATAWSRQMARVMRHHMQGDAYTIQPESEVDQAVKAAGRAQAPDANRTSTAEMHYHLLPLESLYLDPVLLLQDGSHVRAGRELFSEAELPAKLHNPEHADFRLSTPLELEHQKKKAARNSSKRRPLARNRPPKPAPVPLQPAKPNASMSHEDRLAQKKEKMIKRELALDNKRKREMRKALDRKRKAGMVKEMRAPVRQKYAQNTRQLSVLTQMVFSGKSNNELSADDRTLLTSFFTGKKLAGQGKVIPLHMEWITDPDQTVPVRIGQAMILIDIDFVSGSWRLLKRVKKLHGISPHHRRYIDRHFKRSSSWWGYTQEAQDQRKTQTLMEMKASKS